MNKKEIKELMERMDDRLKSGKIHGSLRPPKTFNEVIREKERKEEKEERRQGIIRKRR